MRKLYRKILRWAFLKYVQKNKVSLTSLTLSIPNGVYERGDLLQDGEGNLYVYLGDGSGHHLQIYEED